MFTSGACKPAYNDSVTVNVLAKSSAGTISGAAAVCTGANSKTLTLVGNIGTTIQWQSAPLVTTGTYTDIAGANSTSYIASDLTATTFYRAIVTNGVCAPITGAAVGITVSTIAAVATSVTGGGDVPICNGTTKVLTLATGYTGTIKWQSSATSNGTYSDIALATAATYTVPATLSANSTTYYKALLTSGACTASTTPVTILVGPAINTGTITGTASVVCSGLTSTLTVAGNDSGTTIQWQKATTLTGVYANITSAMSATYATPALTATSYFRALITNTSNGCSSGSAGYAVTVNLPKATAITGSVSATTALTAICTSASQTLTMAAGSIGTIQWQWAGSATATVWTDIVNANATTLAASSYVSVVGTALTATYFRVKMTNDCPTPVYSAAIAVFYKNCIVPIANNNNPTPVSKTIVAPFDVKAYPNPYASAFQLDFTTSSESQVEIRVYDMIGKLIEVRQFSTTEMNNQEVGNRYSSGIYNVIVTQGENMKTLRVIKK